MDETWRKSSYSLSNGNCVETRVEARWQKSSHSHTLSGQCVEVKGAWRKSSHSGDSMCVEVARGCSSIFPRVLVRDSKDPDGARLAFDPAAWREFTDGIKAAG